jgi:predicted dehydrogenase
VSTLNVGIIGTGGITLQNHLPGLALCRDVKVTALCDSNPATLETARQQTGAPIPSTNWEEIVAREDVRSSSPLQIFSIRRSRLRLFAPGNT